MRLERIGSKNLHVLRMRGLEVWFSYETPIALKRASGRVEVCENEWSPTTGRHLGIVEEHVGKVDKRIPHEEFLKKLDEVL